MSWFPVLMKHIRYNVLEVHLNEKINLKVDSKFLHEFPVKIQHILIIIGNKPNPSFCMFEVETNCRQQPFCCMFQAGGTNRWQ